MRINKRKCNEFPNMLNCLPNKETNRNEEKRTKTGAGTKAPNNMCATVTRMEMEICLAETQRVRGAGVAEGAAVATVWVGRVFNNARN